VYKFEDKLRFHYSRVLKMLFKPYQIIIYSLNCGGSMGVRRKFSLYDIEQFLREAGAERVTEDAVMDLEKEIERLADRIANKAVRYAAHAGRKRLIKREDILLTRRQDPYSTPANFRRNASTTKEASMAHK
jgi:histone H3/H4